MMLNFATVQPFTLKRPGLGYGSLKCVALKPIRFELTEREHKHNETKPKAAKFPPRKIKQAVWKDTSRYTGEKLRKIRAARGVGRPIGISAHWQRAFPMKEAA